MKHARHPLIRALALALCLCAVGAFPSPAAQAESAAPARNITGQCAIRVSGGKARALTDGSVRSGWGGSDKASWLSIALPEGETPGRLLLEWEYEPTGYEIEELDAADNRLRLRDQSCAFPAIVSDYDLLPETRTVQLRLTDKGQKICELAVLSAGDVSDSLQHWQPPVEKADLMVISTHQDDELLFFGGVIPYCDVAEGHPTEVVYMADCGRSRRQEALSGLWAMGVRTYPEFINLPDKFVKSIDEGMLLWYGREHVLEQLVTRIRRYRPEVILTHDLNGEYGHKQHQITARSMQAAIDAAADPNRFPASAAEYGAWQVKKLYLHLYPENQLLMDWHTPLEALGGLSPLESARLGYSMHKSQHKNHQVQDGGKYDNALFGLSFTAVGPDTPGRNDFFENVECVNDLPPLPTLLESPTA